MQPATILWMVLAGAWMAAPPLNESQRADLATALDGGDHREQAFFALVEHVRDWPAQGADDEPIRLAPDWRALLERPQAFRGDLCRIAGALLQQTPLAPPYEDVSEWFVRDARSGTPVIVYVTGVQAASQAFGDREQVQIDARFYKRIAFEARDGRVRDYPAFVGRYPAALETEAVPVADATRQIGLERLWILGALVALLLAAFVVARIMTARTRRSTAVAGSSRLRDADRGESSSGDMDDADGLPDDPAEALAELRRRSHARGAADAHTASHAPDHGPDSA